MDIRETLAQRGNRYGDFTDNAEFTQRIMEILMQTPGWQKAPFINKEGAHMIIHKLVRAFCGDPLYDDNWRDIAGFSTLVMDRLSTPPHSRNTD